MTHPRTPREKVARAIQAHDNDHVPDGYADGLSDEVSDWSAYLADRVLTALASGSGDHAELARLAEAATPGEWRVAEHNNPFADGRHVFAKGFDGSDFVVLNLKTDHTFVTATSREQQQKNALFCAAANPATVLALIAEVAALRGENDRLAFETDDATLAALQSRATEAERKLAEAVGLLLDLASWFDGSAYNGAWVIRSGDLGVDDAICAARTFLSKEAERG